MTAWRQAVFVRQRRIDGHPARAVQGARRGIMEPGHAAQAARRIGGRFVARLDD